MIDGRSNFSGFSGFGCKVTINQTLLCTAVTISAVFTAVGMEARVFAERREFQRLTKNGVAVHMVQVMFFSELVKQSESIHKNINDYRYFNFTYKFIYQILC
jgi:peroxiredoxin family protein